MRKVLNVLNSGILLLILSGILGCGSDNKPGSALPFDEIEILQDLANTLKQPKTYSAKVEVQGSGGIFTGELRVDRETTSVLKLEQNPVYELTLNQQQVVQQGVNRQTFDLNVSENLDWLRIGELFVLEPNLLPYLKRNFNFKTASPLKDILFVTAYPTAKPSKIQLLVMKFSQNPLRLQTIDLMLKTGTLACHAEYSDFTNFNGAEIATKIEASWMVDWKPQSGVFILSDLK
jgi:hypothetical protein